jgi:hypothetical protein
MRHAWCCFLALSLTGIAGAVRAQEPIEAELEFVRKLRARGDIELAREYLERMQKRNDPKLAAVLPLEQARTLLAAAREKEPAQRLGMFAQARNFLDDYATKNAGKPEAAQGKLELARLSTYEGQALLTKALRELDATAQQDLARPAEAKFGAAANELAAAIKLLQGLLDDPNVSESLKKQLKQELTQARFDRGANFISQARTVVNTSKEDLNLKRAQIVQEAKKVFDDLKNDDAILIRSQANAWLMKIAMESQDPGEIEKFYTRTMGMKSPEARAGQRWARLFDMQDALTNTKNLRAHPPKTKVTPLDTLHHVQKLGLAWLKDYPAFTKAPEGEGVLWELANVYHLEAKEAEKDKKHKPPAEVLFTQAQKYYGLLAQGEGDFSEKANQVTLGISFQLMGNRKDFRTFDEFFLKGQFELLELQKIAGQRAQAQAKGDGKEAETLDKDWKNKLGQVRRTFARAVSLATDRTPILKLDEARYYLTTSYLWTGDLYRAAIAGEALGRTRPPTRRAPAGAGYAIDAYASLLQKQYTDDTKERMQNLIEFVLAPESQKFWANDPVTAVAHYQMAMLAKKDGEFNRAIDELARLPKDFPGYIYAQGQLVFIAVKTRKENTNLTDREKKDLTEKIRAAAERMPPLPPDADPSTAVMYYLAQLELSKILYGDAVPFIKEQPLKAKQKYVQMRDFLKNLAERFEKSPIKITPANREAIDFEIRVMQKYANLGQAEVDYREEKFDDVLKVAQPVVDAIKKLDNGKDAIKIRDYQITGDILGLALRAEVRKGNVGAAKGLLETIKRLTNDGDAKEGAEPSVSDRVVQNLVAEISQQVEEVKNKPAELQKVQDSFRNFLDEVMKDRDMRKLPLAERRMLARAFTGLALHEKASELYQQVQAPKALSSNLPFDKLTKPEQDELVDYWSLKWEHVKALRAAKDYASAYKVLDGTKDAPGWLNHPKAMFVMPYGVMEKNFVLEDDKKYGFAFKKWTEFMESVLKKAAQDPKMKRLYFEGYFYRTRTLLMYGLNDPAVKDKQRYYDAAAQTIVSLEFSKTKEGWDMISDRYDQLLKTQPELKKAYDRLKQARMDNNNKAK